MRKIVTTIHIRAISPRATRGVLCVGFLRVPCRLGSSGIRHGKREGDGATPAGNWKMIEVLYRSGRSLPPRTALPVRPIALAMGWCDAAGDRNYNRPVSLPYPASHEAMARADGLYDIVAILSHNRLPRSQGLGSAVFFHLTGVPATATAGCVAVARNDMLKVLRYCGPQTRLKVWP